jgi:hypothetical protein
MSFDASLQTLESTLASLRRRQIGIADFCHQWRAENALLASLPARYRQVMEDLLGRLEAGSLFTEESCSFSQEDLHEHLATWLDKARQTLQAADQA